MAKANKSHPQHSKPYSQKVAQRQAVKRSMRTGGNEEPGQSDMTRPDEREGSSNPRENSQNSGGPNAERAGGA